MSNIRKQSIISSFIVYVGFALGLFNTYLFTKEGGFTKEQYGLTSYFIAFANIAYAFAGLGMPAYISKFFPYYNDRLETKQNDMLTWALIIPLFGFLIVLVAGLTFKDILVDKVFNNSPQILQYYYWLFPFSLGLTIFAILEAYLWQHRKAVLSNFFKEFLFRFFITILIALTFFGLIETFDVFIKAYSFIYLALVLIIIIYLIKTKRFHFTFSVSNVTKRFFKKIITLCSFVWSGGVVFTIAGVFDTIVITAVMPNGLAMAGIFTLAQNASSLIQAPQRGIISASIGPLSQAWKDKDYKKINRIYHRSSINLLLFASAMFCLIWLNFSDGIYTFNLQKDYLQAMYLFFFIGLTRVIDMGTGVNAQIIGTSTFWRFEFLTGLILLGLALPLNFFLTREYGLIGPAISNLIAFSIYNAIRFFFLYRKLKMQPFTTKTLIALLLAIACYFIAYWLFKDVTGFIWMIIRSLVFLIPFIAGALLLNLSPDIKPIMATVKKRLRTWL